MASLSAQARPYLYYLASRGVAFGWEWVIAAERHILTLELLPPAVAEFIQESITAAVGLGYGRKSAASKLFRTLKAIYLHRPAATFREDIAADITGLEQSLFAFDHRPDLYGSAEAFRRHAKSYREAVYALRLVLYHRGLLPSPPARSAARPERARPHPLMESFADVTRAQALAYSAALDCTPAPR